MINETAVAIRGNVATDPTIRRTESGTALCSFRIAVTAKRYLPEERKLTDVDTSFYTVTCWRSLAENVVDSIDKGDGVLVVGRLRMREFVHEGVNRTSADIVADSVGHDLFWGTTALTKAMRGDRPDPDQAEADALADEVALTPLDGLVAVGAAAG